MAKKLSTAMLDEWFKGCNFDEMQIITGYAYYEFSSDDGYQDYIDTCDEIWEGMTYGEKISAYHKVNE